MISAPRNVGKVDATILGEVCKNFLPYKLTKAPPGHGKSQLTKCLFWRLLLSSVEAISHLIHNHIYWGVQQERCHQSLLRFLAAASNIAYDRNSSEVGSEIWRESCLHEITALSFCELLSKSTILLNTNLYLLQLFFKCIKRNWGKVCFG